MTAAVVATQLTTPDTTRAYTVTVNSATDISGDVFIDSLVMEDQGTNVQATTTFEVRGVTLADLPNLKGQALLEIVDHVSGSMAFRGFVDSHDPDRRPGGENVIKVTASDHTSLLDNIIPFEARPAGEGDAARLGYLWGKYAGAYLNASLAFVQEINASLPAQQFAGISLRQAIDMIAAQASTSTVWYLDRSGRLHYFESESNDAPENVTSDTPGAGEIAARESLRIDFDSKNFISRVYVRGKTDAGSGWVYSEAAKLNANGLQRDKFLEAPDCTTEAMRNALGNMYLGRLNAAKVRGEFMATSPDDGWRAGQNVNVRSSHHGVDATYRIARVRTSIMGTAAQRRYDVEFGNARAGSGGGQDPAIVMGRALSGDLVDDNGALLLSSSPNAFSGGLGPGIRRYILSGVYNGGFALAPASDGTIVNSYNPLPFWSFVIVSGTSIFATSVEDSAQGSGRAISMDMAAGAAGDDAYLEQIIPINSSRTQNWFYNPRIALRTGATVSTAKVYITAQYLAADGATTTGTEQTSEATTTEIGAVTLKDLSVTPNGNVTPSDAAFLRVRVGLKRDAAATSTVESVTFAEVSLSLGNVRVWAVDETGPGTYSPGRMLQAGGNLQINGNYSGAGGSAPQIMLYGSAASPAVGSTDLLRLGGDAFPASPTSGDWYPRTDLRGGFFWDGTRWLSSTLYRADIQPATQGNAATFSAQVAVPLLADGSSDIWLEDMRCSFFIFGGTALSGSHKWVATFEKIVQDSVTVTTIGTVATVDSGTLSVWRDAAIATIDALVNSGTIHDALQVTWTKTGTPGNITVGMHLTYRMVAT